MGLAATPAVTGPGLALGGLAKSALVLGGVATLAAVYTALGPTGEASGYPAGSGIPKVYWPMHTAAGAEYGVNPYLLASIHKQESQFSGQLSDPPEPALGVASGRNFDGCCAGPMQFYVTMTWPGHQDAFAPIASARPAEYPLDRRELPSCRAVPADQGCVYDDFDAIAAAAHKLSADGADMDLRSPGTHEAVCRYIGACSEVDNCIAGSPNRYCEVLPRAIEWERLGEESAVTPELIDTPAGGGELAWPTPPEYTEITSGFGMRWGRMHNGVDIPLPTGTPIGAAAPGRVTHVCQDVSPCTGYGNFVCVQHRPDLSTCYAHLNQFAAGLSVGSPVSRGEVIGFGGSTGASTGPHLHFEVRLGRYPAQAVDPVPYLTRGSTNA